MDTTTYSKTLLRFGIICCACGYILNNFFGTLLGIFIFLYLYFIQDIAYLKIEGKLEGTLKERQCSKIVFKAHGGNTIPALDFSSPHGTLSYLLLKGDNWRYIINVIPFKKGEFILDVKGKVYDIRELFSEDYSNSFKLQVEPSVEGLKYHIEKENQLTLLSKGTPDPEIGELKLYEVGDDPRRIDWKRSLKVNKLLVRKLQHLEDRSIYLLLDVGSSMRRFAKRDRNKLDYALSLLLSILAGIKEDLHIILYEDYRIRKKYLFRKVGGYPKKDIFKKILEDLEDIKTVPLEKYIPNTRGVCKGYKNQIDLPSIVRGNSGILQCAKLLSKMKIGTVIVITDLESNILPLFKSVDILSKKGFKVVIYALYTPSFNLDEKDLLEGDILLKLYKHYKNREKIIKNLRRRGAIVVDVSYRDSIKDILNKVNRRT